MMNEIKSEVEKRTGLPANVVDQVLNALGQIIGERYPQYAGMIGPILGVSTGTGQSGTSGTSSAGSTGSTGSQAEGALGELESLGGSLFGGQSQGQGQSQNQGQGNQGNQSSSTK
jgi:hypothetical protein